ncbi:unnamed protein product [Orchesella dallaii]|uniref:DH domain-containing protein n=1 Tax=Orchesella dallaii TaxID=48710 RepID=A0ABP1PJL3_9HEXA
MSPKRDHNDTGNNYEHSLSQSHMDILANNNNAIISTSTTSSLVKSPLHPVKPSLKPTIFETRDSFTSDPQNIRNFIIYHIKFCNPPTNVVSMKTTDAVAVNSTRFSTLTPLPTYITEVFTQEETNPQEESSEHTQNTTTQDNEQSPTQLHITVLYNSYVVNTTDDFDSQRGDRSTLNFERSLCRTSQLAYRMDRKQKLEPALLQWMTDNPANNRTHICTFLRNERAYCRKLKEISSSFTSISPNAGGIVYTKYLFLCLHIIL